MTKRGDDLKRYENLGFLLLISRGLFVHKSKSLLNYIDRGKIQIAAGLNLAANWRSYKIFPNTYEFLVDHLLLKLNSLAVNDATIYLTTLLYLRDCIWKFYREDIDEPISSGDQLVIGKLSESLVLRVCGLGSSRNAPGYIHPVLNQEI